MNNIIQTIKPLLSDEKYFYFVIEFKHDCKYHYQPSNSKSEYFNYQDLNKMKADMKFNLKKLFRDVIKYQNSIGVMKSPHEHYDNRSQRIIPGHLIFKKELYDDLFSHAYQPVSIEYKDMSFAAILEFSPKFSKKDNLLRELPDNVHLGTHLHIYVKNPKELCPFTIVQLMSRMNTNWTNNIHDFTTPKIGDLDFYDELSFLNYHLKQPTSKYTLLT